MTPRSASSLLAAVLVVTMTVSCGGDPDSPEPAATPTTEETVTATTDADLVDVGPHSLHAECSGAGAGPTVVFLHGLGGEGEDWLPTINGLGGTRTCWYDRLNVGRSDSDPARHSALDSVTDLHALLTEIGGGGPYLLVGHSYGGLLAEMYAATYPAEVSGLVLVDATLTLETTLDPPSTVPAVKAEMNDNGENLDAYEGYAQARRLEADLPDIPVTYILAEEMDLPAEWSPREYRRRVVAWIDSLPRGELVSCPCDHHIPRSAPALIAQTIQHLADEGTAEGARLHDIGDRELLLDCRGTGSPTVILEPGQGDSRSDFEAIQDALAATLTACTYDRANVGQSGTAPTPRTSLDVVEDLHALLGAADVAPPYVLAGASAGGFFAMHFARQHPDEVIGVLAMNPPPLATDWVKRAYPLLSAAEVSEEKAFLHGDNPESYDWAASGPQLVSAPAPDVPFVLLHSTVAQCEGEIGACSKTADLYLELGEEYAAAWPAGRFEAVDLVHAIHLADQAKVVGIIEELAAQ